MDDWIQGGGLCFGDPSGRRVHARIVQLTQRRNGESERAEVPSPDVVPRFDQLSRRIEDETIAYLPTSASWRCVLAATAPADGIGASGRSPISGKQRRSFRFLDRRGEQVALGVAAAESE